MLSKSPPRRFRIIATIGAVIASALILTTSAIPEAQARESGPLTNGCVTGSLGVSRIQNGTNVYNANTVFMAKANSGAVITRANSIFLSRVYGTPGTAQRRDDYTWNGPTSQLGIVYFQRGSSRYDPGRGYVFAQVTSGTLTMKRICGGLPITYVCDLSVFQRGLRAMSGVQRLQPTESLGLPALPGAGYLGFPPDCRGLE